MAETEKYKKFEIETIQGTTVDMTPFIGTAGTPVVTHAEEGWLSRIWKRWKYRKLRRLISGEEVTIGISPLIQDYVGYPVEIEIEENKYYYTVVSQESAGGGIILHLEKMKGGTQGEERDKVEAELWRCVNFGAYSTSRFDKLGIPIYGFEERFKKLKTQGMATDTAFVTAALQQYDSVRKATNDTSH